MKLKTKVKLLDTVIGLVIAPGETTQLLLSAPYPRYGLPILLLFYLSILVPVAIQSMMSGMLLYHEKALAALLVIPTLTVVLFVFAEAVFLRFFAIRPSFAKLASSICYALMPLITIFLAMYVINYMASGSIAYLTIVLNGYAAENVAYKQVVPWVVSVGFLLSFIVFFHSLKTLGDLYPINALMIALLSMLPLVGAFTVAVVTADFLLKGLSGVFQEILLAPSSMLGV